MNRRFNKVCGGWLGSLGKLASQKGGVAQFAVKICLLVTKISRKAGRSKHKMIGSGNRALEETHHR